MGKVAIITGAASGIGHFLTVSLAKSGFEVVAIDRHHCPFENSAKSIRFVQADLCEANTVASLFKEIPRINLAVNCAGVSCERKDLTEFTAEEVSSQWQENFLATFNALKNEILVMRKQKSGKIINLSSITAHRGMKNFLAYSASKASISSMTKVAAIENAAYNIQVNSISPATIDTPMIRKKYNGQKRDYSDVYYTGDCGSTDDIYAAVKMFVDNRFLTGHDLKIDGGLSDLCQI